MDNVYSEKQQRLLTEPLHSSWRGRRVAPFVAMANVGLFDDVNRPPLVPDMLLSMDVELPADLDAKNHRCYFGWEYGKPPDVVVEIVSNREGGEGTTKLGAYADRRPVLRHFRPGKAARGGNLPWLSTRRDGISRSCMCFCGSRASDWDCGLARPL